MLRDKLAAILMVVGCCLVLSSFGVILYNNIDERMSDDIIIEIVEDVKSELPVVEHDEDFVPDYKLDAEVDMPVVGVSGADYLGILSIPALDLDLPVQDEWSYPKLKQTPCRFSGSVYLNNMMIVAHNYKNHFGRFPGLNIGDLVIFKDFAGNEFNYSVAGSQVVSADSVDVVAQLGYDLVLCTCTNGGTARFVVYCDLTS